MPTVSPIVRDRDDSEDEVGDVVCEAAAADELELDSVDEDAELVVWLPPVVVAVLVTVVEAGSGG